MNLAYAKMDARLAWHAKRDLLLRSIARMLPRRLVMWCYIRVAANATMGQWGDQHPDTVSIMTALQRWDIE